MTAEKLRKEMIDLAATLTPGTDEHRAAVFLISSLNVTLTYGHGRLENIIEGIRCQAKGAKGARKEVYDAFFQALKN